MAESLLKFKRLEWKWVWVSLGLYVVFYFLPMYLVGSVLRNSMPARLSHTIISIWFLGGIFLVAAFAAYKSKGVTIWEPVLSSVGALILMFIIRTIERGMAGNAHPFQFYNNTLVLVIFFSFSLVGSICGEMLQANLEHRSGTLESADSPPKFQWMWVAITLMMYVVLYLFPIYVFGGAFSNEFPSHSQRVFAGAWIFAGIIVTAALAGFMSKGVTIWEPVVGSIGFIALTILVNQLAQVLRGEIFHLRVRDTVTTLVFFFLLSLLGAWLGELWQKTITSRKGPSTAP